MAWTADTAVATDPGAIMDALTRPQAISAWAPVPFEVEGLSSERLEAGSTARVAGRLGGKNLAFDVEVHEADSSALRLTATGAYVEMNVAYDIQPVAEWSQVHAEIDVRGKGIMGRFVARAVEGFIAGGALKSALDQLALAAENSELTMAGLAA